VTVHGKEVEIASEDRFHELVFLYSLQMQQSEEEQDRIIPLNLEERFDTISDREEETLPNEGEQVTDQSEKNVDTRLRTGIGLF
jgi:hypothetical protein